MKVVKKNSRSATTKKPAAASVADRDLATVVSSMLGNLPGVRVQRKLHNLSFLVREKVFAFTRRDGVVLRLPEVAVRGLLDEGRASPLVMGKRVMREWVVVPYSDTSECLQDFALVQEAMQFVASLRK